MLVYCSPACGMGCTRESYLGAHGQGKQLALAMGKGWTYRVWEHLGWHYEAVSPCGRVTVSPTHTGFFALLGEKNSSGARWGVSVPTARVAVQDVIRLGKAELRKISALLAGL